MADKKEGVDMSFAYGGKFCIRGDVRFLFIEGYLSPGQILEWEKEGKLEAHFDPDRTKYFLAEEIEDVVRELEEKLADKQLLSDVREIYDEETDQLEKIEVRVVWRDVGTDDFDRCLEYTRRLLEQNGHDSDYFTLDHPNCDWFKPERLQEDSLDNAWVFPFKAVNARPMPVATRLEFPEQRATLVAGKMKFPVVVHQDYQVLDKAMIKAGYEIDESLAGWIATMPFEMAEAQARTLNEKLEEVVKSGRIFNVGFNQTGHFSIGYTIYTRKADDVCSSCGAVLDGEKEDCIFCQK